MKLSSGAGNIVVAKLTAAVLCIVMLAGCFGASGFSEEPYRLVDTYCSQSAKDALGYEQLQSLVGLIVKSIEPQAVNLIVESFPCFSEAAENDALGREIGLYIYYGTGDEDGIMEHKDVLSGAYAYVNGYPLYEAGEGKLKYMICIDAETLVTPDDMDNAVLNLDGQARIQVDTTFCHELFHAFMYDYNRAGMSGYTDLTSYVFSPDELFTEEEGEELIKETQFPSWFIEGTAGCVGNIYPADLYLFREYHYDIDAEQYIDTCNNDQLLQMYVYRDYLEGSGEQWYDMEASLEGNDDGETNGATYVSGYMACLYLADLGYQALEGSPAVTFDQNGDIQSLSSEKLREGLSEVLRRLHRGDTLDEVIHEISGGAFEDTKDFTERFVKGNYNEEAQAYDGEQETLSFCVGFLNYMYRLDAMDPDTHPAGSLLMDDFGSTQPTPLEKDAAATSDFYRFVEKNTLVDSTVPNESVKDGGTSYSSRDDFETVVEMFKAKNNP